MAKKSAREQIKMECTVCKTCNYHSEKNKTNTTTRVELKKFCKLCKKVQPHKEGK
ncbi:50S ribosomal protein L33 [Candidatus Berkelbacteria bacterium RIFCSPLOWO2_01_FULL_50_28]|uniref:Large ribosomal subunit protein bL33 n=1 Tax=Candidatus Berkelbacteria bacterium RIFCSPLOWO2_01_FULL_50_28 TaxID=1797471 RepID=A0A1F5EBH8_9BACT|nr:MAG: 50S ribosomal protein L33 [Candidatus Berkelbacteria bacterium RIFCSPHIGHO2_12_FULL_50_11]OGD64768.1 MAG: 50S ribosomal protein L33 [Candidatus Berkelbacteria bacterium RIFCSPLOWO2_01_FULL_50_28]